MLSDYGTPTIEHLASLNLPITLPSSPSIAVQPCVTFHSRLWASQDVWSRESPFEQQSLDDMRTLYRNNDGGAGSYHSLETNTSTSSMEHLSVSFGISIGSPLFGASATGAYDKDTLENQDARKLSVRSSFRAGSIILDRRPRLSREACLILKHQGGLPAFKRRFGDYYVCGYRLGGDAAVFVSDEKSARSITERLSVKVTLKVLLVKISKTWEKFFTDSSSDSAYSMYGFDTLDNIRYPAGPPVRPSPALLTMLEQVSIMENRCNQLAARISMVMEAFGLEDDEILSQRTFEGLLKSNLVVDVLLMPLSTLREVQQWSRSKNVIGPDLGRSQMEEDIEEEDVLD